jgi:hypothetical protein
MPIKIRIRRRILHKKTCIDIILTSFVIILFLSSSSSSSSSSSLRLSKRSVRAITPNVVIAVCTDQDAQFIEDLAATRFHPDLVKHGASSASTPVLTLAVFELQSPQSLPVAAVGLYVRTVNKVGGGGMQLCMLELHTHTI